MYLITDKDSKYFQYYVAYCSLKYIDISVGWKFSYMFTLQSDIDAPISLPFSVVNLKVNEILCCGPYDFSVY